jgi:nucleoside 2-deoxyribosyltransferase
MGRFDCRTGWRQELLDAESLSSDEECLNGIIYGGPDVYGQHGLDCSDHKDIVWALDLNQIRQCDIVYARLVYTIDTGRFDAYGTLAEIGAAKALGIPVVASVSLPDEIYNDLWFVLQDCEVYREKFPTLDFITKNYIRMPYKEYLKTDRWKDLAAQAKKSAGHRCQMCNSTNQLDTHHRSYTHKGTPDEIYDLVVLCHECHSKFHNKLKRAI